MFKRNPVPLIGQGFFFCVWYLKYFFKLFIPYFAVGLVAISGLEIRRQKMGSQDQGLKSDENSQLTKIEILFKDVTSFLKSYIVHVRQGGLFVKTENPLPLDSRVFLRITLPEQSTVIEAEGRVVLTNPYGGETCFPRGMGIKFEKINSKDVDRIAVLTENNMPRAENLFIL